MAEETATIEPSVGPQVAGSAGIDPALIDRLTGSEQVKTEAPPERKIPTVEESVRAATKQVAERVRGPDGKFAPKTEAAPVEAALVETVSQQTDKTTPQAIELPAAAKGLLKATDWSKLARPVQEALAKDFASLDGYVPERVKGDVEFAQAVRQRMAPHEAAMRSAGFTNPIQGIDYLVKLQDFASRDFNGYARWVAQQAGLTVTTPAGSQPATPQQFDPLAQQLAPKVQGLEAQVQGFLNAQTDREISAFQNTKDAQGKPAYPHFDAVRKDMGDLIVSGKATDLADAYQKAVWLNPDIREKSIEERLKAAETKKIEEQRKATETAQKAASPPKGAPGGPVQPSAVVKRGVSVEDSIRNSIRQLQANA